MKNILNKEPISVDFNNCGEDGEVRLTTQGTLNDMRRLNLTLVEGQRIWITDGEIEETGIVTFRHGIWVVISDKGSLKDVDEKAPYHNKNRLK